jgi:formate-dependent phosphoribosylglycinamide formyltransferase (GAR transformylase)
MQKILLLGSMNSERICNCAQRIGQTIIAVDSYENVQMQVAHNFED